MASRAATLIVSAALVSACSSRMEQPAARAYVPAPHFSPNAGPAPVRVTAFGLDGSVASGAPLALNDASGSLTGVNTIGATGSVDVAVDEGGSVTVASMAADTVRLQTVLGVTPGMNVTFGSQARASANDGQIHVRFLSDLESATQYEIQSGCAPAAQSAPGLDAWITLTPSCDPSDVTLLVIARNDAATVVGATWIEHVAVAAGSVANASVGDWNTGVATMSVDVLGTPGANWVSGHATIWKNGFAYTTEGDISGPADQGGYSAPVTFARNADRIVISLDVYYDDGVSGATIDRSIHAPGSIVAINLATDLLPRIQTASLDMSDASHPVLSWTADAGMAADAVMSTLEWADTNGASWEWTALSNSSPSMRLPVMPVALAGTTRSIGLSAASVTLLQQDGAGFDGFISSQGWAPAVSGDATSRSSWRTAN